MHEQDVRSARNVWVACDRENAYLAGVWVVRKLSIEVIEVVSPDILNISRVHPAVAVGTLFDEHHGRQVIDVPASRNLDQASLFTSDQRLHPRFGLLGVVDLRPGIASTKPVHVGVIV